MEISGAKACGLVLVGARGDWVGTAGGHDGRLGRRRMEERGGEKWGSEGVGVGVVIKH